MEAILVHTYRHLHTTCCLRNLGVCGISPLASLAEISLLRTVSKKIRGFIKSFAHEPPIAYQLFLYHTKKRCVHEIQNAISRKPRINIELKLQHDDLSHELFQIVHEEMIFLNMNHEWVAWANKQWGVRHSLSHARSIAISSSCNEHIHYELIHRTYTCDKDIQLYRFYVFQKLAQLANIPPLKYRYLPL